MKKIIITLSVIVLAVNINAQRQIRDLDLQNTYDTSYYVVVDYSTLGDSAKKMSIGTLAPKIKYETLESSQLDRDVGYLRFSDNASNSEFKIKASNLVPKLHQLPTGTTPLSSDYLFINTSNTDYKIAVSTLTSYTLSLPLFDTKVDQEIESYVTQTWLNDKIAPASNIINGEAMINGSVIYGWIYAEKRGNSVVGYFAGNGSATPDATGREMTYVFPSDWWPTSVTGGSRIDFCNCEGSNFVLFGVNRFGTIFLTYDDNGVNRNVGFSWVTF